MAYLVSLRDKDLLRDIPSVSFLMLIGFIPFVPELLLGLKLVDGDLYRQVVPTTAWYGRTIREGGSILWTSGILGGFPSAFSQYALLFPLDWVLAQSLDPDRALALSLALHLPIAGIATYAYGRVVGLARLPSLLAACGYQLSTESLALGIGGYLLRSLFLLPTLLLCVELIIRRGRSWMVVAALALGASLMSGTAYIVAITTLNAGFYTLVRGLWLWRKGLPHRALLLLVSMGAAVVLGIGLAAVRVLPTLTVTAESVRAEGLPFEVAAGGSATVGTLLAGYLLPLTRLEGFGGGDAPSYVGPVVLLLAIMAVLQGERRLLIGTFAGLLLFNLLASLGSNGPVFGILHQIPPFTSFRTASRFSVFSAFFLSMLAAMALDRLGRERTTAGLDGRARQGVKLGAWLSTLLLGLAVLSGVLWSYGGEPFAIIRDFAEQHQLGPVHPLRPRILLALVAIPSTLWLLYARNAGRISRVSLQFCSVAGTAILLLMVGLAMLQFRSLEQSPPATARFLQEDNSQFRVMSFWPVLSIHHYLDFLSEGGPEPVARYSPAAQDFVYRYLRESLAPNFPLQFGLESIDGYEVLQSRRQAIAMTYLGSDKASDIGSARGDSQEIRDLQAKRVVVGARNLMDRMPVYRAFNVKYVITNLELWQHVDLLRLAFTSQIPMLDPRTMTNVHVYEVIGALPRIYLVPDGVTVGNELEALDAIMSGTVDPSRTVMLERSSAISLSEPQLDPNNSTVEVTSYTDGQVVLQVQASGSGFLVVNDAYYPGWRAWVDGTEVPIHIANGWVRAIEIPSAGTHAVYLRYEPPLLAEGQWVSLVSLLVCLAVLLYPLLRSRRADMVGCS